MSIPIDTGDLGLELMSEDEERSDNLWASAGPSSSSQWQASGAVNGLVSNSAEGNVGAAGTSTRHSGLAHSSSSQAAMSAKLVSVLPSDGGSDARNSLSSDAATEKEAYVSADEGAAAPEASSVRDGDVPASPTEEKRRRKRRSRRSREPSFSQGTSPLPKEPAKDRPAAGEPNGPQLTERRTSMSRSRRTSSTAAVPNLETVLSSELGHEAGPSTPTTSTAHASEDSARPRMQITTRRSSSRLDTGSSAASPTSAQLRGPASPGSTSNVTARNTSLNRFAGLNLGFGSKQRRASARAGDVSPSTSGSPQSTPPLDNVRSGGSSPLFASAMQNSVATEASISAQPATPFRRKDLQRYVLSVGCVTFDLDHGPELEFLYPALGISTEERDNIAFSSFPDTSIFDDGFSVFSWRVREVPLAASRSEPPTIRTSSMEKVDRDMSDTDSKHTRKNSSSSGPNGPSTGGSSSDLLRMAVGGNNRNAPRRSGSDDGPTGVGDKSTVERHGGFARSASESGMASSSRRTASASSEPSSRSALAPSAASSFNSRSTSYIYGYVFFRQRRDPSIRRGYFQKSVVILSHLPYVSLFSEAISQLGPRFFEHGMSCLEAFCSDVARWPDPTPGATLDLPFLGTMLRVTLPENDQQAQIPPMASDSSTHSQGNNNPLHLLRSTRSDSHPPSPPMPSVSPFQDKALLASIPSTSLFRTFQECLPDLWLLWECLLIAEPILVVAPDPARSSEAIWHAIDLVRPVPFAGDFRPFFHIHDYDFPSLVNKNQPRAGTLLGVTNPFFAQACAHWPNILRIGKAAVKRRPGASGGAGGGIGGGGNVAGGSGAGGGGPDHLPGLTSKRKRRISKDRPLLRRLADMAEKGDNDELANSLLRRYFASQTELFLAPLNRYVSTLIPADFDLSSPSEAPRIHPFNTVAFLAGLKAHGTPLLLKNRSLPTGHAQRQSLYVDFLQCPNFSLWLQARIQAAEQEQRRRRVAVLERGDVTTFARARGEIETVDLYTRLLEEIRLIDSRLSGPTELGPGSRWRTDDPTRAAEVDILRPSSAGGEGESSLAVPAGAQASKRTFSAPQTQGQGQEEQGLAARRARLVDQLDRLALSLPEDLRSSLPRSRPTRERTPLSNLSRES